MLNGTGPKGNRMIQSVELLLQQVERWPEAAETGAPSRPILLIENWLTLQGVEVPQDLAIAIVLDRILAKGYRPNGFVEADNGRLYQYEPFD